MFRYVVPIICKLSLLLATVQAPLGSMPEEEQVHKCAAVSRIIAAGAQCRTPGSRHRTILVANRVRTLDPRRAVADQRTADRPASHGHVLHNGLRAPLLC